jgi:hypothetical protein
LLKQQDNLARFMYMEIPEGVKTYDLSASTIWFDKDGILYSMPKPGVPDEQSVEEIKQEMEKFRAITGNKKVCMVLESNSNSKPPSREMREFIAEEIESVTKAMAIITRSPLARMLANLFFGLKPPSYPVKMFTDEKEATAWIKQFL